MTLPISVLLVVAALAVAVRIVQSRSTIGVALIGVVVLGAMAGMAWRFSDGLPLSGQAHAADADEANDELAEAVVEEAKVTAPSSDADVESAAEDADDSDSGIEVLASGALTPTPPDWVKSEDVLTGDTHFVVVTTGPHEKRSDCSRSLDDEMIKSVNEYIDDHLGKVYGDTFQASTFVNYDLDYIRSQLREEEYEGVGTYTFGDMHEMYVLLKFDSDFQAELDGRCDEIDEHWRKLAAAGRLTGTALAVGFILALLGVVFGYFRLDTATRGYYTGRLQFASAVVILTLIVVGVLVARHIL